MTNDEMMNDPVWDEVADYVDNALGMYFDGCHKIYLAMDEAEKAQFAEYGYDYHTPDLDKLKGWFEESCGLRFVNAVHHNEKDPNAGFEDLIPQCYFEDEEDE
jgi:hypothetical protein